MRVAAFLILGRASHPDLWESEDIAINLLAGRGFIRPFLGTIYRSYMEPLHPGLCAGVYALTGHSFLALGLVQAVLGTLLVWLVFVSGRRMATDGAGLLAAGLAAVHPGLIGYTTKFSPFVLDSLLLMAVLTACLVFKPDRLWRSGLVLGGAIGLCALSRATSLVWLPLIGWWVWRQPGPRRVLRLAVVVGAAAVVLAPWVVRNHAVHHRLMLTRSGGPLVFWLGNNPYAFTGSAASREGVPLFRLMPAERFQRLLQLDELGQQDFLGAEAVAFVRADPLAFVRRWAVKLGHFWWQSPQAGRLYPAGGMRAYQAFYVLVLLLAVGGAVAHRRRPEVWLAVACCVVLSFVQSVFFVEGRHRLAIEPVLLLLAGAGLVRLIQLLPWGKKVSS